MRLKVLLLLLLITLAGASWYFRPAIDTFIEQAMLPYRIAKFTAEPAPSHVLMPVAGAQVEDVTDTWGTARSEGRIHEGQDIFAPTGTPVYPAADGYVVRVGQNDLGGNIVVVLGRGSRGYYYAHLDRASPDAEVGAFVTATSTIGYVGATGNASGTPPHLHFGIYTHDGPINPYPYLQNR